MSARKWVGVVWICALFISPGAVVAEEFRIRTRLFQGDAKESVSENVTIFHQGIVYDFLSGGPEVTVFDAGRGRLILLNRTKKQRSEIRATELESLVTRFREKASEPNQPAFLRFQAQPDWDESKDEATLERVFASPFMTYRVASETAPSEAAARQWVEFSNACARLNTVGRKGLLPFPRLFVNKALGETNQIPTQVKLTINNWGPLKDVSIRTEHLVVWNLKQEDLTLVERTAHEIADFAPVSFTAFHETPGSVRK